MAACFRDACCWKEISPTLVTVGAVHCPHSYAHRSQLGMPVKQRDTVHLHQSATLSFMISGHTKFAPDWCFGLFNERNRRTLVSTVADIASVVNSSTVADFGWLRHIPACLWKTLSVCCILPMLTKDYTVALV